MKFIYDNIGSITSHFYKTTLSPKKLKHQVNLRASMLKSKQIGCNDKVIILHGGTPTFFCDLFAVWEAGACAVCLNPDTTNNEIRNIISFLQASVVLVDDFNKYNLDCDVLNLAVDQPVKTSGQQNNHSNLDDDALMLFTSGTTGTPKGVVHTFRSLLARIEMNQLFIKKDHLSKTMCPLPTHFGHGLIGNCLTALLSGGDIILVPGGNIEVVSDLGGLIDHYKITFISSVPSMWKLVLQLSSRPENNSLKRVHIGSAPLSSELWNEVINWSGADEVVNMYGITETANWICGASSKLYDPDDGLIGTSWGGVIAVIDNNGNINKFGEGEIVVQTSSVMKGYFNLDKITGKVLKNGWFYTGDIGNIDLNGKIYLTGRKKFEINRSGLKIHPEEIDSLLERHDDIVEACAFSIPDNIAGEIIGIAVALKEDSDTTIEELIAWCSDKIIKEKTPDKWFIVEEVPKTDRGKINRDTVALECTKNY